MRPGGRAATAAAVAAAFVAAPAHALPSTLALGFLDDGISFDPDPADRAAWLERVAGLGANVMRVNVTWSTIATRAPLPGDDPKDPTWPGYNWSAVDAALRDIVGHG